MLNKVITTAALLGMSASVQAVGRAVVVNQCSDPITLTNVPASGGGQSQIGPQQISTGGSYSQVFTPLSNGQGWSLKLSKGSDMNDIVQFEYTYDNNGIIWYDLSAVNGDPWNGDWALSGTGDCDPKQTAYRYPTDNAYGMQSSCSADNTISVTLCPGGGSSGSSAPSGQAPPSYSASPAASGGQSQTAPASQPAASPYAPSPSPAANSPYVASAAPAPSAGANKVADAPVLQNLAADKTVTHVATTIITQWVTVSPQPVQKRNEHIHRHGEFHNHF